MQSIDVIVPTYQRPELLGRTLRSLSAAQVPQGVEASVLVVDNEGSRETRQVVEKTADSGTLPTRYVHEEETGISHARNRGLAESNADLVAMIDDDMAVAEDWFATVVDAFASLDPDFIGGPYLPEWEVPPPDWLPESYPAAIGWIDLSSDIRRFGGEFEGMLMGGNAVFRREVFEEVGWYDTSLGRSGVRLTSGEDAELYRRLLNAGLEGYYMPELEIYHWVPRERLTKWYYRKWVFWCFASGSSVATDSPSDVPQVLGIPRWRLGKAIRSAGSILRLTFSGGYKEESRFEHELALWELAGAIYGRHFGI